APAMDSAMKACEKYLPAGKMADLNPQQIEQFRQFTACMREHGVDLPDPDPNGGGLTIQKGQGPGKGSPDDPTFQGAKRAGADKLRGKGGAGKGGGHWGSAARRGGSGSSRRPWRARRWAWVVPRNSRPPPPLCRRRRHRSPGTR